MFFIPCLAPMVAHPPGLIGEKVFSAGIFCRPTWGSTVPAELICRIFRL